MDNVYLPKLTRLVGIKEEGEGIKTYTVRCDDMRYLPGQFALLSVFGVGEAPFSFSSSPTEDSKTIKFTIQTVGKVTSALENLKVGDIIGIRGPFGKPFPTDKFKGRNVLLIAGGIGIAPLRSLAIYLLDSNDNGDYKKIVLLYGVRSPAQLVFADEFKERVSMNFFFHCIVQEPSADWTGRVGVVSDLFDMVEGSDWVVGICGPQLMLEHVIRPYLLGKLGVREEDIYVSLEQRMSCGVGHCGRCHIGKYYVCVDGPVFNFYEVNLYSVK